jgi:hypothetical protein
MLYLVAGLAALQGILVLALWNIAGYACAVPQQDNASTKE